MTGEHVDERPGGALAFAAVGLPDGSQVLSGRERDSVVDGHLMALPSHSCRISLAPSAHPICQCISSTISSWTSEMTD